MKVTFPGGLAQYFKPDTKPEMYESLSEELIPRSELIVYAKTTGIDPACLDWWSPWDKETSKIFLVVLDMCGMDPPVTDHDALIIRSENGVDVIKAVDNIGVSFKAEVYFFAGLKEGGLNNKDDGSYEPAVSKIEFVKRLTVTDWNYYMDLMHRSDKALKLYHAYAESAKEDRIEAKKSLRPKLTGPIIATVIFLIIWWAFDFFGSSLVLGISLFVLLSPWINVAIRLVRYVRYKP
jgi:hypothetical protein